MKTFLLFSITVAGVLFYAVAFAAENKAAAGIPNFTALDDKAASNAADAIVANHRALEQELTSQLNSEKTPAKRKVLLIYALGHLRSRWAAASLVKMIDFPAPFTDPKLDIARWGPYPAVGALTNIGNPAVDWILKKLPEETNQLRVHLMLTVIRQVEGSKPGRAFLEKTLAEAHEQSAKRNLQKALTEYDRLAAQLDK